MTGLDWIIVALAALLAVYGFGRGFIVGVLSLVGFGAGAVIGTRLGPDLLSQGSRSPYAPAFGLMGALLAGVILASGLEGVGLRLRAALRLPGIEVIDGLLGAALSAFVALGVVWIGAAVAVQLPGYRTLRADIQRSVILSRLNEALPPSGPLLNALARFDPLPSVAGPTPALRAPPPGIARSPRVRAAAASVVRVLGSACGLGVEGSGWVAGSSEIVTNAHVVAGESDTAVEVGGRPPDLPAQVVALDARNDIAVLRVPGLGVAALTLAPGSYEGRPAAVMGFPDNGAFDVQPARVGSKRTVESQDAYGQGPVTRLVTPFRGLVRPGNSGGPLIDAAGRVVATVFAATVGGGPHAGYGVPAEVLARDLASVSGPVSTGPCSH